MNFFFVTAAAIAAFNTALHFYLGGQQIARPLLDAPSLSDNVKYVQYFCWHIATLTLAFQAVLFVSATIVPEPSYAIIGTALAASVGLLGLALPVGLRIGYRILPQGWLFVPVAAFGVAGLVL